MTTTPKHFHRIWYFTQCGKHRIRSCEHCAQQFQHRMHEQIKAYEKQEPIEHMLLESIRIREFSKLLKESDHG